MTPFHAFAHALHDDPDRWFLDEGRLDRGFAPATQWVVVLFMILGGINFALMYRAIVRRQPRAAARDEELRLYLALLVARLGRRSSTEIWTENVLSGRRRLPGRDLHGGLDDDDDRLLGRGLQHLAAARADDDRRADVRRRLRRLDDRLGQGRAPSAARKDPAARDRPDAAPGDRPAGAAEPHASSTSGRSARSRRSSCSTSGSSSSAPACSRSTQPAPASSSRRSTRSRSRRACSRTSGPRFGIGGPLGSFEPFSDFSTMVMTGLMWLGRLEVIPIVVLLSRHYWRS